MPKLYDVAALKKVKNVSLNSDLLQKARGLKINLSAALEKALKKQLQQSESAKWKSENKIAMEAYNEFVSENGNFGDEYRTF